MALLRKDCFIAVICHKKAKTPGDPSYCPIEVGAAGRKDHFLEIRDDLGEENISSKNGSFCELTGLYWAYKNVDCGILGLVHYRRYFMKSSLCLRKDLKNVLSKEKIERILSRFDIILPKKRHYWIETNESHFVHAHPQECLEALRRAVSEDCPDYLSSFDAVMRRRSGHYFNMFIAKREVIDPLLAWMFSLLFRVEKEIDPSQYDAYNKRVFGFLSELLFDVYCLKNELKVKDQKYLFFEKQNWIKKGFRFLERKFRHGKA